MIISLFSLNQQPAAGSETLRSVTKQTHWSVSQWRLNTGKQPGVKCVVVEEGGVFYALPALNASC